MSEDYKINGSSYDLSKVPKKALEKDDTIKKNKAFDLIFDALDKNKKDAKLDSKELATFFSNLKKADTDKNKDISQKELEAITKELNKQNSDGTEIKVADVEGFFSHVMAEASDVEDKDKISVEDALKAEDSDKTDTDTDTDTDSDDSSGTHSYTVQMDEDYTDIIKRSLKAKGVEEPTEEQIKTEKENFEKNNPGAVKRNKSGVEYLLVGAQVKLEGKLENKDNSQEQIDLWVDKYINKKDVSDRVDDPQGADSGEKGQASEVAKKAEEAGYRKTYSPDFFYDEKTKKHMKYNSESGKFEVVPNLTYVDKNGNQTYVIQQKGNLKRKEIRDKKGNITTLQALTNYSHVYTNPKYVAQKLGLDETFGSAKGVYYNKATKQHFVWDSAKNQFVAKNEIRTMYKDGTYMGTDGKKHSL